MKKLIHSEKRRVQKSSKLEIQRKKIPSYIFVEKKEEEGNERAKGRR